MPGYVIANLDVTDPEGYEEYKAGVEKVIAQHSGRYLVRGGQSTALEGDWASRFVVVEFPSYDAALAFYDSAEYQELAPIRRRCSTGSLAVVDGYAG